MYNEKYKTLKKQIEEPQINGKIFCAHGLQELILLKCPYYPKQSTDLCNPYQNFNAIFHRNRASSPKICMVLQKNLKNQNKTKKEKN